MSGTGATADQVMDGIRRAKEIGVKRLMTAEGLIIPTDTIVNECADFLVPPGKVIADATDVLTPELKAALTAVVDRADSAGVSDGVWVPGGAWQDLTDALRAAS